MGKSKRHVEIEELEQAFWQSMIDNEPKAATAMLAETALMVSGHGVNRFDHDGYTKMAKDERFKLLDFQLSKFDVLFPNDDVAIATYHVHQNVEMEGQPMEMDAIDASTWVFVDGAWKCAMHTESLVPPPQ